MWCSIRFVASQSFSNIIETIWYWWLWDTLNHACSMHTLMWTSLRSIFSDFIVLSKNHICPNNQTHTYLKNTSGFPYCWTWMFLRSKDLKKKKIAGGISHDLSSFLSIQSLVQSWNPYFQDPSGLKLEIFSKKKCCGVSLHRCYKPKEPKFWTNAWKFGYKLRAVYEC